MKLLDNVECRDVFGGIHRIRSVREYGSRDMKANGVNDDHCENCTEDPLFPHNEMKPRVQNDGLASDHAIPADGDDSDCNIVIKRLIGGNQPKELKEESERMQHTAITGYEKRPEIETSMPFKSEEDLDIELGDIVPCDSSEGSYGHIDALVERNWAPRFSFRDGHFEGRVSRNMIVEGGESKVSNVDSFGVSVACRPTKGGTLSAR